MNEDILGRIKVYEKDDVVVGFTVYKSRSVRFSFQIPFERFDDNTYVYHGEYAEAEIRLQAGIKKRKTVNVAAYASLDERYFTGERKDIDLIFVRLKKEKFEKIKPYNGKATVYDNREHINHQTKSKKQNKKRSEPKVESYFMTPYKKPEEIKVNLCRHPSRYRSVHGAKTSPTKVYKGGKMG